MATMKMAMTTLSGPSGMVDMAIQNCVINREFHLENAMSSMSGMKRLSPFDTTNPYSPLLQKVYALADSLGIELAYRDFDGKDYTLENTSEYTDGLSSRLRELKEALQENELQVRRNLAAIIELRHLRGLDEQLTSFFQMKYVKFRFGRVHEEDFAAFYELADERDDVFYFQTGSEDGWIYGLYLALPSIADQIDSVFVSMGFERTRMVEDVDITGTADEVSKNLKNETAVIKEAGARIKARIAEIKAAEEEALLSRYSFIRFSADSYDLRSYAGHRNGKFYIIGWVPSEMAEDYVMECESIEGFSCILTHMTELKRAQPPVKTRSNLFTRVFWPFIQMYGLPAYSETDPGIFMAVTYTLLFGIMFGDVGQGILLSLFGLLLWNKKKMWLGRVLICVGISATAFGFVYGNLFGYEHILPGFKVLEGGNTMTMLIIAVAIGVVLILICMGINIVNGFRDRDIKRIFFSANGFAGAILYISVAAGAVSLAVWGKNLFTTPYILGLIVLPLLLIMAAGPLTRLIAREKDWLPESIGMFLVEGFFDVFETVLSYVSNTVSFLRVGAFAISHAGMMMVVFLLSETAGGGNNIVAVIIGNLVVIGIEATLVCIQVMRLEFYEMFGRFYSGTGRVFTPKTVKYEDIPQKG